MIGVRTENSAPKISTIIRYATAVAPTRFLLEPGKIFAIFATGEFKASAKKAAIIIMIRTSFAIHIAPARMINPKITSQKRIKVFVSISILTFIAIV